MEHVARFFQFVLATVVLGSVSTVLAQYEINECFILSDAVAGVALIGSLVRMVTPKNRIFAVHDFLQLVAWAVALGFLGKVSGPPVPFRRVATVPMLTLHSTYLGASRHDALWL